jgi:hypothetical protein
MKKFTALLAAMMALLMLFTACAKTPADVTKEPVNTIEGAPMELLGGLVTDAEIPFMCENAELSAENVEWLLGLTADDYSANVVNGAVSMAMMSAQAHMVALLECKDFEAAKAVKEKLHTQFDIRRWVCVIPEMCYVIDSGKYVFFVASGVDFGEALLTGFKALAQDNVGERLDVEGATGKVDMNEDIDPEMGVDDMGMAE